MCTGIHGATAVWTGSGADMLASTALNWSNTHTPHDGDIIIFNEASVKHCMWDVTVSLHALTVTSDYTGTITISPAASLILEEFIAWTGGGADSLASNPANWAGNKLPQSGDALLFEAAAADCIWDLEISPDIIRTGADYEGTITLLADLLVKGNVTVDGGIVALNEKRLSVHGTILIGENGTVRGDSSIIVLSGNWRNTGTFDPGTSSMILNGKDQIISGNNVFYNLAKSTVTYDSFYFEAGKVQTVLNNLVLEGANSNLLSLRSTVDGTSWSIDPQGTRKIAFASIQDMNNINAVAVVASDSSDEGNNTHLSMVQQCACGQYPSQWSKGENVCAGYV